MTTTTSSGINWDEVDKVSEKDYDYELAPEATAEFFKTALVRMPSQTKPVTIRLKSDTLEYFKEHSTHYQRLINAVLDAYVAAHKGSVKHA